jgi:integrase
MQRDWSGSVFQSTGLDTYSAKYLDFDSGAWKVRKGFATMTEARDFLSEKKGEYRACRRGDRDQFTEHRRKPLSEHRADFIEHVRSGLRRRPRKRPNKHVDLLDARLERAFDEMGAKLLADITLDKASRFLNRLLDVEHVTPKTRNDYAAALKQFGRWCEEGNRLAKNPLAAMRKLRDDAPQQRQDLAAETVRMLAAAPMQRVRQQSMAGNLERDLRAARRRSLTLLIAFLAGLRNNELANLIWRMVEHENNLIALPAAVTKSGREEFVPLHAGLAWLLREVRRERGVAEGRTIADSELVVGYLDAKGNPTLPVHLAERIREDAEWIKLPVVDSAGRKLDLHAMRTSFANELDRRGVHDGIIGDLMRHRGATVTRRNYVRRDAERLREFIDRIPLDVVHVDGLLIGEPRETPKALRAGEAERAPMSDTKAI